MIAEIQHDQFCGDDYRGLREVGILTARDGLRWHRIDRCGSYDWSSWIPMLEAARGEGIQVIWDLFHYGWPDDLDIFSSEFIHRFARFAREAARVYRDHTDGTAFYAPMNEISFFSWAAARPLMYPYADGSDARLKRQLVRATIAAIDSIRSVDSRARFLAPEPLIHNVPPQTEPWNAGPAQVQRDGQFEAWDMIAGRSDADLEGAESYLDIIGANFYAANQWEVPGGHKLHWDGGSNDPRWMPLHQLLIELYARYRRPIVIAETSHYGCGRASWLEEIAREVCLALTHGVSLEGVCLYSILDRLDWEDRTHWHNCGLWDIQVNERGHLQRVLNTPYANALRTAQDLTANMLWAEAAESRDG